MATAIPPHNLGEVIDACIALLKNEHITDEEIFTLLPAPDFPTGGIICGRAGIVRAYKTGRGNLVLRGVVEIEETKKGTSLVVTELPYQVIKAELAIKIADLVKNKTIDGITNIRDESNKKGIRFVIDIRRGENPHVILNQLYKFTPLQTSVTILLLGLLDNRPLIFNVRQLLREFLIHRENVIQKRIIYDLKKSRARAHILEGFIIALNNIDEAIAIIKASMSSDEAQERLIQRYSLSIEQTKAILEMRLQRLTGLEQDKIRAEMDEIKQEVIRLEQILANRPLLLAEIEKELIAVKRDYSDPRRSRIEGPIDAISEADLIPDEDVVVTLTRKGYIKRVPLTVYGVQHRGGKGKMGMADLEDSDDVVADIFATRNHDELLFFTNVGRIFSLSVFEIPEASRTAKGRAVINLLSLQPGEHVVKLLCTRDIENKFMVMVTKKGTIKRTEANAFAKIRSTGIRAITLNDNDELAFCSLSTGNDYIVLATGHGMGIRFKESEVRSMGRQAAGVRGIRLRGSDYVIGMQIVSEDKDILFATEKGYGKRVRVGDFRVAHRGGMGVRTIPTGGRNG
jgi:DNA gyrase subunit A